MDLALAFWLLPLLLLPLSNGLQEYVRRQSRYGAIVDNAKGGKPIPEEFQNLGSQPEQREGCQSRRYEKSKEAHVDAEEVSNRAKKYAAIRRFWANRRQFFRFEESGWLPADAEEVSNRTKKHTAIRRLWANRKQFFRFEESVWFPTEYWLFPFQ